MIVTQKTLYSFKEHTCNFSKQQDFLNFYLSGILYIFFKEHVALKFLMGVGTKVEFQLQYI